MTAIEIERYPHDTGIWERPLPRPRDGGTGIWEPIGKRGEIPGTYEKPFQIPDSTSTSFPNLSPWVFLAQAVGNIVGGLVGQNDSSQGNQQQVGLVNPMQSMDQLMMQYENNRLLKELLEKRDVDKPKKTPKIMFPYEF